MFFFHLYFVFTDRDTDTERADLDKQNGRRSTGSTGSDGHDTDNMEAVAAFIMATEDTQDTTKTRGENCDSKSHKFTTSNNYANSRKAFNDFVKAAGNYDIKDLVKNHQRKNNTDYKNLKVQTDY